MYFTRGNYESTDEGLLIGYKVISYTYGSIYRNTFRYVEGEIVTPDNPEDAASGIFHCCNELELERTAVQYLTSGHGPLRMVRIVIDPKDLVKAGIARRAYVDAISAPFDVWGRFLPERADPTMTLVEWAEQRNQKRRNPDLIAGQGVEALLFPTVEVVAPPVEVAAPAPMPAYFGPIPPITTIADGAAVHTLQGSRLARLFRAKADDLDKSQ